MSQAVASGPWRDLRKRFLTAALLGPATLACIWLGGHWFNALMALCLLGLAWEWVRMCHGSVLALPGVALPTSALLAGGLAVAGMPVAGLLLLLPGAALAFASARRTGLLPPTFLAAGVLYIGVAGVAVLLLRHDPLVGRENVIFLFLVVWASDIAAYVTGRALGGPKLAPMISPGKTWSGSVGGLVGAMLVGLLAAWLMDSGALSGPGGGAAIGGPGGAAIGGPGGAAIGGPGIAIDGPGVNWTRAALVAVLLAMVSQAGDLLESGIKRRFGVKDSSQLIPGHGGLLDRLDGVIAAAPVAALLSVFLGLGVHLWR